MLSALLLTAAAFAAEPATKPIPAPPAATAEELTKFVERAIKTTPAEKGKQRIAWQKERAALVAQLRSAPPDKRPAIQAKVDALNGKIAALDTTHAKSILIPRMDPAKIEQGMIGRLPELPPYKPGQKIKAVPVAPEGGSANWTQEPHRVSGSVNWRHPTSGLVYYIPLAKPIDLTPYVPEGYTIVDSLD